jgi:hypothetical protein
MAKKEVWKALLTQHAKLRRSGQATLYDRVTLLNRVFEDEDYAADCLKGGRTKFELLDQEVSDTCANFLDLLQILKLYPQRRQWEGGNLAVMRDKMYEHVRSEQAKRRQAAGKPKKAANGKKVTLDQTLHVEKTGERERATLAEVKDLKAENERLKHELKNANDMIRILQDQVDQLRETNGSLNEVISIFKLKEGKASRREAVKA